MIKPLADVVYIRRSDPEEVSDGGVFLAWDSDYKEDIGEVVAVGPGKLYGCKKCKTEHRVPLSVKPGDRVLFSTNGHQISKIRGQEYVVLREPSIIAVIEGRVQSGTRKSERQYMGVE